MQEREENLQFENEEEVAEEVAGEPKLTRKQKLYYGIFMCWGSFTWIPCPNKVWNEEARLTVLTLLQVLGALLGWLGILLFVVMQWLNLPVLLQAAILAIYPMYISGFIHVDGFMDCCDAIGARSGQEKAQKILKDSRVGAFAVIGLSAVLMINFASIASLNANNLMFSYALFMPIMMTVSRWNAGWAVATKEPIQASQYNKTALVDGSAKTKFRISHDIVFILTIAISIVFLRLIAYGTAAVMATGFSFIILVAQILFLALVQRSIISSSIKAIGGMNGDISGYSIVVTETVATVLFVTSIQNFTISYFM